MTNDKPSGEVVDVLAVIRGLLSYDPETGVFRWLKGGHGIVSGAAAGAIGGGGYLQFRIDGRKHYAHRLAWLYVYGRWPEDQIDHINGIRSDNRIANLREATRAENQQNRAIQRNSTSGAIGVNWHKRNKKWRAEIKKHGKRTHVGYFDSIEDAVAARIKAKAEIHTFQPFDRAALARTPAAEEKA